MLGHWFKGVSNLLGAIHRKVLKLLPQLEIGSWKLEVGRRSPSLPLALLSLVVAVLAQGQLDRRQDLNTALVLYWLAAILFALIFWPVGLERSQEESPVVRSPAVGPLTAGLALGFLSFFGFAHNRPSPLGVILWLGGLGLCLWSLLGLSSQRRIESKDGEGWAARLRRTVAPQGLAVPWEWIALGAILAVGAFYRLVQLDPIPADMGWDMPYNFYDTRRVLQGEYHIFFPDNLGREGLFFYLSALCARIVGLSPYSLKLTTALIGLLTIPALYLLARELFNREVAFYAAALLALNKWHIVLSRSGFRVMLLPLFAILVLYFLSRALSTRQPLYFGLTGLCLGLGLHTYKAFLFVPPTLLVALVAYALSSRERLGVIRHYWPSILLIFLVALVAFVPLGRYIYESPRGYLQREMRQWSTVEGPFRRVPSVPLALLGNLRRSLLMFNYVGDGNSRFNVPFQRHMGFVSGVLFVLGSAYVLLRWRHGHNVLLLTFLALLILPMTLTMIPPDEAPNIFRSAGQIGPALIVAALPLALLRRRLGETLASIEGRQISLSLGFSSSEQRPEPFVPGPKDQGPVEGRRWEGRWEGGRVGGYLLTALVALVLLWEARETYTFYFQDYVYVLPDRHNYSYTREMAAVINDFAGQGLAYVKPWPHWYDGHALRAQVESPDWGGEIAELNPNNPPLSTLRGKALFILHPEDQRALATLRAVFPQGIALERRDFEGQLAFITFYGER
jgi:4-amino-4-deoxy-L-arabinose transferase-like glycosyltransferase